VLVYRPFQPSSLSLSFPDTIYQRTYLGIIRGKRTQKCEERTKEMMKDAESSLGVRRKERMIQKRLEVRENS
jgi:hypothetical protein